MDIFDDKNYLANIEMPKVLLRFDRKWFDISLTSKANWEPNSLEISIGIYPDGVNLGRKLYSHFGLWKYDFYLQIGKREHIQLP